MPLKNDLSRSLVAFEQDRTLVVVLEISLSTWLVAGLVPGIVRQPAKKLGADEHELLKLIYRWRAEASRAGREIDRICVAFEAGRDGFWLARWLAAKGMEAYVIHSASVAVSREHRRAKTDRLDTELLKRAFLAWLRGDPRHCGMAAIPTVEEEDARRPSREREKLVGDRTRIINRMKAALGPLGIRGFKPALRKAAERLDGVRTAEGNPLPANTRAELRRDMARLRVVVDQIKDDDRVRELEATSELEPGPPAMVRLIARIVGIGVETADMLVREVLSRALRDRQAIARYAGLTGSPDERGSRRPEKGPR